MIKVSIIVPVYNVYDYVEKCLASLTHQTLKDIEIIIVNDGSTDGSDKICQKYKDKYSNIKYISQKNMGLSGARNTGIKYATGEFIGFVDSDDFVKEDMFETLYNNAKENNTKISACGHLSYYADGTTKINSKKHVKKFFNKDEALDYFLIQEYFDIVTWNKIYKRELFKNIKFPVGKIYEDFQTIYKLIAKSDGIYFDSTPKYFYFKRENSISNSTFNNDTLKIIEYVDNYVNYCKKNVKHIKYLYIGVIRWYLTVVNKMISSNQIDQDLVAKLNKLIDKNLFKLLITNKIPFIRKSQIFIFRISFNLYKTIYLNIFN